MLPNLTHNSQSIHPCIQNEFQFKVIYTTIHDIIFTGRFSKMCHEFYVVLDFVLWIGLFVLERDCFIFLSLVYMVSDGEMRVRDII